MEIPPKTEVMNRRFQNTLPGANRTKKSQDTDVLQVGECTNKVDFLCWERGGQEGGGFFDVGGKVPHKRKMPAIPIWGKRGGGEPITLSSSGVLVGPFEASHQKKENSEKKWQRKHHIPTKIKKEGKRRTYRRMTFGGPGAGWGVGGCCNSK